MGAKKKKSAKEIIPADITIPADISIMIGAPKDRYTWSDLVGKRLFILDAVRKPTSYIFSGELFAADENTCSGLTKTGIKVRSQDQDFAISTVTGSTKCHLDGPVCFIDWYGLIGRRFSSNGNVKAVIALPFKRDGDDVYRALPIAEFEKNEVNGVYTKDINGSLCELAASTHSLQEIRGALAACLCLTNALCVQIT